MSSQDTNSIEKDREGVEEVNRTILLKDNQRRQNASSINIPSVDTEISKMTADQKRSLVPELRELSRSIYLEKREKQQLELLETEIKDEEFVFDDSELTEHERMERDNKRLILEMAKKRSKPQDDLDVYVMPTSKQTKDGHVILNKDLENVKQRYNEKEKRVSEQENWDENQRSMVQFSVGAQDKQQRGDEYDYVMENEIEFVDRMKSQGINAEQLLLENKQKEEQLQSATSEFERIQIQRASLPVTRCKEQILEYVKNYNVIIVEAETGSGKTTQIPQFLYEAGYTEKGMIGCTQPRRVACMEVAARVSKEMGCKLGNEVGYSVRFENKTNDRTIIKYLTDGMLFREFLTEPDLSSYSVMIIDEAHERALHTDVILGLIKDVSRARDDLKIIISSATMDSDKFSKYFDDAPVLSIPGRRFSVTTHYLTAPENDYIEACIVTTLQIHVSQPLPGDILVFLTGQDDIEAVQEGLTKRIRALGNKIKELLVLPLYSSLPRREQQLCFEKTPEGVRKVVLATNVAETSLTIDNICYVVDSGLCKQNSFNPRTGMDSLIVTPISQAAANQREGRAGRTRDGHCFRLYTEFTYDNELPKFTIPEIQRTNLASVILTLKSIGIPDILHFDFVDPPPVESLMRGMEQLYALCALNDEGELTKLGRCMAEFPCDPTMSKCIVASEKFGCVGEILTICAMLDVSNSVYYRPKNQEMHADNAHAAFAHGTNGDHIALLNVYNRWKEDGYSENWCYDNYIQYRSMVRARDVRDQLEGLCDRVDVDYKKDKPDGDGKNEAIRKGLCTGFFYNICRLQKSGEYHTIKKPKVVSIHPSSSLFKLENPPEFVLFQELVFTTKEYIRIVSEIQISWLKEIAPHYYNSNDLEDESKKKMPKLAKKN